MSNDKSDRVYRGGGWHSGARCARDAYHGWAIPSYRGGDLGFRLSRVVKPLELLAEVINEQ